MKNECAPDLPSWKQEILENCRLWLSELPEMPNPSGSDEKEAPDLYAFYEQLCVLRNEFRKNSRRSHELFSQFGDHLEEFESVLESVTERVSGNRENERILARQGLLLPMVELYERLCLFGEKMEEIAVSAAVEPSLGERIKGVFTGAAGSRSAIPESLREGFSLLLSHFRGFLEVEGVSRISTEGEPFDPAVMVAVGTKETDDCPPGAVHEEISGGYLYRGQILKLAKVTVVKRKEL